MTSELVQLQYYVKMINKGEFTFVQLFYWGHVISYSVNSIYNGLIISTQIFTTENWLIFLALKNSFLSKHFVYFHHRYPRYVKW